MNDGYDRALLLCRWLGLRLAHGLTVIISVTLLTFLMVQYLGDPLAGLTREDTTAAERAAMRERLGLDRPAPIQFARYAMRVAQGDLGVSFRHRRPVGELLLERLPATVELALTAFALTLAVALPLGIASAVRPSHPLALAGQSFALLGISVPTFVTGVLLVLVFAVQLDWLPAFGRGTTVAVGGWQTGLLTTDGRWALLLPATTLALYQIASIARLLRAEMGKVLASDAIRFARARGVGPTRLYGALALRNAALPLLTVSGIQLGTMLAFSIVTETIFQWPGLGLLFLEALQFVDIPVLASYLLLTGVSFVLINGAIDLAGLAIDPRLRRPVVPCSS